MAEQIPKERMSKWVWKEGDIVASDEVYIPKNLRPVISEIPKDDEKALKFLQGKIEDKTITTEEFRFILRVTSS